METVLHFVSTGCVLLLNGSFVQSASTVRYESTEPLYVTVLPLEAMFLPYTVEILGGKATTNQNLVLCCDMGEGHYYIELKPRYAYVYSPSGNTNLHVSAGVFSQLLEFVQKNNFAAARALMTESLSESVSDEGLSDFFDGVIAVRENVFTSERGYLLLKSDGTAQRCNVTYRNGRIENIVL